MKRVLFGLMTAVAVAATATPANAAFSLRIELGTYNEGTGVFTALASTPLGAPIVPPAGQPVGTLFYAEDPGAPANSLVNGASTDILPPINAAPRLLLSYNLSSTSTSVSANPADGLSLSYQPSTASDGPLTVRVTLTETDITLPGAAGSLLAFTGQFTVEGANPGAGTLTGFNVSTTLTTADANPISTTIRAGNPPPDGNGLIPTQVGAPPFGDTRFLTRGASSSASITDVAIFRLAPFENLVITGGSSVSVAAVPAPATALMGLFTLPVLGLVARVRRGSPVVV